jgi:hypothetical protein
VGFMVDKVAMGQVFSQYFGFPCQFSFHRLIHIQHHLSSGAGTIGQLLADVRSGLSLIPPPKKLKKELPRNGLGIPEQVKFTIPTFLMSANDRLSLRPRFCTLPLGSVDKNSRNVLSVHLYDPCVLVTTPGSPRETFHLK